MPTKIRKLKESEKEKLTDFVPCQRQLGRDVMDGKLSPDECWLVVWLRLKSDKFGITYTSYGATKDDAFPKKSISFINYLFLSAREKGYIKFPDHKGKKGSFRVENDYIRLPNGTIKRLNQALNDSADENNSPDKSEVSQTLPHTPQRLEDIKTRLSLKLSGDENEDKIRGHHNDTDNHKNKNNLTDVYAFSPKGEKEERLKEIAIELGETTINAMFALKIKYGLPLIEQALTIVQNSQSRRKNSTILNPAAYLTTVVDALSRQNEPLSEKQLKEWEGLFIFPESG
jgi:hypothetical protein